MHNTMNRKVSIMAAVLIVVSVFMQILSNMRLFITIPEHIIPYFRANFTFWVMQAALAVALFRGKKDVLGGVLFAVSAVLLLTKLFNVFSFVNLLLFLFLAAVAAACLLSDKLDLSKLKVVFVIVGIVVGLFSLITNLRYFTYNMGAPNIFALIGLMFRHIRLFFQVGGTFLRHLIVAASYACIGFAFASTQKEPQPQPAYGAAGYNAPAYSAPVSEPAKEEGYISLGIHVLLLLVTGGIWLLIWVYRTTGFLNRTPGEEQLKPANKLLLCMFIPFYSIYWTYKQAQRVDKLAQSKGIDSGIASTCLILGIFLPIVAFIMMQDKINKIAQVTPAAAYSAPAYTAPAYTQPTYTAPTYTPPTYAEPTYTAPAEPAPTYTAPAAPAAPEAPAAQNGQNAAYQELKQLKELLDAGFISQEDYEAKKKQILGL